MTRSQFILAIALLVVAGTIAFTVSFRKQERRDQDRIAKALKARHNQAISNFSASSSSRKASNQRVAERSTDRTRYEVSAVVFSQQEIAEKVQRESLAQLEEMTSRYQLTGTQRRQLFALLAKHHNNFQDGMVVNGQSLYRPASGEQLASEVYPLLDPSQQDLYQDDILSKDQWWSEIITQLRDDLDGAIESGEMIAVEVDENGNQILTTSIVDDAPAQGDGTAIENNGAGINLNNLIGQ